MGLLVACYLPLGATGCERQAGSLDSAAPGDAQRPNIIFVLIDALRADRLGVYGHKGGLTPTMDAIAAEGVTFEQAIAQSPWTQPSMTSLFCCYYPGAVQEVNKYRRSIDAVFKGAPTAFALSDEFTTLAEALQAHGYLTAGFVTNPYVSPEFGLAQGFDYYDASFAKTFTAGNVVNQAAVAWLRQREASKPLFLYLHYMDVHGPYDAGPEFLDPLLDVVESLPNKRRLSAAELDRLAYLRQPPKVCSDLPRHERLVPYHEYWVARYEAGVRAADHYLAELRDALISLGLWQNAYVILTADHGEALCEHGHWDHGGTVHHYELRVPLILRWPEVLPSGKRIRETVQLMDLMPTVLEQLRLPGVEGTQGFSLLPCLVGQPRTQPRPAFAEAVKVAREEKALYRRAWKLVELADPPKQLLYRIADDPLERHNYSRRNRKLLKSLSTVLRRQLSENARLAARLPAREITLSPEHRRQLEALGYISAKNNDGERDAGEGEGRDKPAPGPP